MAKANAKKPGSDKAGGELPYSSAEKVLGGPVDGKPEKGLGADHSMKGSRSVPQGPEPKHPSGGR